jgi:hypothetical protein
MKTKITILRAHHRGWRNAKIRRTVTWVQRWYLYLAPDTPVIKRLLAVYEMGRRHGKAEERMKRTRYGESTATIYRHGKAEERMKPCQIKEINR